MHTHTHTHTQPQSSANAAVLKLDNHQLGLKSINVAISNPPKRGGGEGEMPTQAAQKPEVERREEGGFVKPTFLPRVMKQEQSNPL